MKLDNRFSWKRGASYKNSMNKNEDTARASAAWQSSCGTYLGRNQQ
jgi:hypothetical protein